MMKEEDFLRHITGKKEPFKVPESYWEDFSKRMSAMVADDGMHRSAGRRTVTRHLRMFAYAAVLCGILFVGAAYYFTHGTDVLAHADEAGYLYSPADDGYVDEIADYAMLDNQDFYDYLSGD